jgi:drug/metabolite transporter (DMT)-like permease
MRAGVGLLILAMLMTPAADGVAKSLAADHPPIAIAFVRYLCAGLVALAAARVVGRRIAVPPGDRLGQVARTALLVGAMTALIAALGLVPMAKAVGGSLIAPVVSGLLGIAVWREPPTASRLAGAAVSFAGAAMLIRPQAGLEPGCLLALLGGALLGAYLAATRAARAPTDALSTLAVQSLLGAAMLAPFALAGGPPAPGAALVGGALALGGISAACHFLTVAAYRRADASVLAPFLYFNLLTATAVGYVCFGESVGGANVAALSAIACGGLIALVEPRRGYRARRDSPGDPWFTRRVDETVRRYA